MKAEELRTLDAEELGGRLKQARRELYELRFKLAVGQLENNREIRKARKDIARILTVIHRHRLEDAAGAEFESAAVAVAARPATAEEIAAVDQAVEAASRHDHDHDHDHDHGEEGTKETKE